MAAENLHRFLYIAFGDMEAYSAAIRGNSHRGKKQCWTNSNEFLLDSRDILVYHKKTERCGQEKVSDMLCRCASALNPVGLDTARLT